MSLFRPLSAAAALSLAAASLAVPNLADAGPRYRGYDPGYARGYDAPSWRYDNRHYRNYGGRVSRHHHRRGLSRTGAAVLGVGVGLIVSDIIKRPKERVVYVPAPAPAPQMYSAPAAYSAPPAYPAPQVQAQTLPAPAYSASACQMTREYQTTVIVGGVERAAYGTACLMPDGSWQMGPATPEPE